MKDILCDDFQNTVSELLIRHQSILDIQSKLQETSSRVNRAVAKAVTNCGCVQVKTEKKVLPPDSSISDLKNLINNHLEGELCSSCRDIIETEMGKSLFYMAALCNTLDINLYDVLIKEHKKISTLRIFNFT
ncbi:hypothetical protein GGQ84_002437 [Desulfitispora alkaliphila]|uniref:DUF1573 domain-containing protein n=1 Tax=Desulfitispora alkaliphila TaxID=622674 RepID=UPI003D25C8DC